MTNTCRNYLWTWHNLTSSSRTAQCSDITEMSQFLLVFLSSWLPFISEASVKKLPFLENILFHHEFLGRFIHLLQLIWIFHIPDITTFLSADFWYVNWLVALFDINSFTQELGLLCSVRQASYITALISRTQTWIVKSLMIIHFLQHWAQIWPICYKWLSSTKT